MNALKRTVGTYLAVARVYKRNLLNTKHEDEAPFLPLVIGKDSTCLHIGATDGRHSYVMAKALEGSKGHIYAFEPSPITYAVLEKVIKLQGLTNKVTIARKAFSNKAQTLTLNVPFKSSGHLGNAFGFTSKPGEKVTGRNGEENPHMLSFDVVATTIDDVAKEVGKVDFIRMDIEGSEHLALKGGMETIKKYKPHMLIEIHPDMLEQKFETSPQAIYEELTGLGYKVYHLENDKLVPSPNLNIRPWKDYFFIHPERTHQLPGT